jgi:polysaccharide biosynthesis transport protein
MLLSRPASDLPPLPYAEGGGGDQEEGGPGLSITQVILMMQAHWKQAVTIALTIAVLGGVAIKLLPKSYTATATLKVDSDLKDPLAGLQNGVDQRGGYIPTEVQLMESPEVLLPVIDRLGLATNKDYIAGFKGDPANLREWIKERLIKDLEIAQGVQGSLLINVTATARNPVLAADLANAVADSYIEQERQRIDQPAVDRARRYTEQLAELKTKVSVAEQQLAAFRQRTGITDTPGQKNVDAETLSTLEHKLEDAKGARREAEVRALGNPSVNSETSTAQAKVAELKAKLSEQSAQLAELLTTLGTRHPKVLELQSKIDATQHAIDAEMHTYSRSTAADLGAARELEQKLQQAVDQQRAKVLAADKMEDEGNKYALELESATSVYKRALDGYDQIMFASAGHYTYVNLASRAEVPLKSTKPNKLKLFVMAFGAALFVGLAGPLCYELFLNRRVRCRDDLERSFRIPVLIELHAIAPAVDAA